MPAERQASAQGLLGGVDTLVAGVTATLVGQIYQHLGRTVAYTCCAVAILVLIASGAWLSGDAWRMRGAVSAEQTIEEPERAGLGDGGRYGRE